MSQHLLVVLVFVFSCLSSLRAQVGFSIPFIPNAQPGTVLDLPVTVSNFDSILSAQFVIRWDPSVLRFESVDNFNLTNLDIDKFGLTQTLDSGLIRFVWWFYTPNGTTKPDGTAIFHLKLKITGPINSGTSLLITQDPPLTFFEVTNANNASFGINQVVLTNGFVAVGYTPVSTGSPSPEISGLTAFPNPFSEKTNIRFNIETAGEYIFRIVAPGGEILFEKNERFPAGPAGMEIACPEIDKSGLYFFIIQSNSSTHAIPLVHTN